MCLAKSILKVKNHGKNAVSKNDLKKFLNASDTVESDESMDEGNDTVVFNGGNKEKSKPCSSSSLSFLNAKLLDFASITETWFQSGNERDHFITEMVDRYSLGVVTRERENIARNGRQYGGVAFLYRLRSSKFDLFALHNPENYEVLATVGRVDGVKGKIFVISAYAPPNLTGIQASGFVEFVSDVVCEAKRTFEDCAVIVTGDFNQWPIQDIIEDHPDLGEIIFGPTRGDRLIDRTFTNFNRSIKETNVLQPLEAEAGNVSDHKMTFAKAVFPRAESDKISYTYRPFSEEGAVGFLESISTQDWSGVLDGRNIDEKVSCFQSVLDELMNRFFPLKTTTRRKSDPPWVNEALRRLSKKRRRVYDKEGRSARWKKLTKKSKKMYRERAENYMKTQKEKLTGPDAARNFYKNVRAYKSREKPPEFDVRSLYPNDSEEVVAEKLATHFNKISKEFRPLSLSQPMS